MATASLINSFNAGEVSPLLAGRVDVEKYRSACQELTNMLVLPSGGVTRRPGTEYLGECMDHTRKSRLLAFNFSRTTRFVIEAGHLTFRFWSNGTQVMDPSVPANPYQIASPYGESDLREMQFVQVNDVVFLFHNRHAPRKLSRIADDNWTLELLGFDSQNQWPPFLDENIEATTLACSHTSGTGRDLVSSVNLFEFGHVGAYFQLAHRREKAWVEKDFSADGASTGLRCVGKWELTSYGTWTADLLLQRSFDNGTTWETIRSYSSKSDRNVNTTGEELRECLLRLEVKNRTVGTTAHRALLELEEARQFGIVKITAVTDAQNAVCNVVRDLNATTATTFWSEGAWSDVQGFPGTGALHEGRLWLAGTTKQPQSIWASVTDDFSNFRRYAADDSSLFLTLASRESQQIQWLLGRDALLAGTTSGEWTITGGEAALTPSNVRAEQQSSYGSKKLPATPVQDSVLFMQRNGRKVRELLLVNGAEKQGYVAPDLTILAEHITRGEIVEVSYQQQPHSVFWCLTGTGRLLGMTYERDQGVAGWHKHTTDGEFESVACIYGTGVDDEVWLIVKRIINGATKRYVERFKPDVSLLQEVGTKPDLWFVDCARRGYSVTATKNFSGFNHLEGKTLSILGNGSVEPPKVVTSGNLTLQNDNNTIIAGLPYESILRPMPLDIGLEDGASMGRHARAFKMFLRFWQTLGAQVQANGGPWDEVFFRGAEAAMDSSPELFTGLKEVYLANGWNRECLVSVKQNLPLPLTVLAMIPRWTPSGE